MTDPMLPDQQMVALTDTYKEAGVVIAAETMTVMILWMDHMASKTGWTLMRGMAIVAVDCTAIT